MGLTTVKDRVQCWCTLNKVTQTGLAKKIGKVKQEIHRINTGKYNEYSKIIILVSDVMRCTPEWLAHGRGDAPEWATPFLIGTSGIDPEKMRVGVSGEINYRQQSRNADMLLDAGVDYEASSSGAKVDSSPDSVIASLVEQLRIQTEANASLTKRIEALEGQVAKRAQFSDINATEDDEGAHEQGRSAVS